MIEWKWQASEAMKWDAYRTDGRFGDLLVLRFYVQPVTSSWPLQAARQQLSRNARAGVAPGACQRRRKTPIVRSVLKRTYIGIPTCQDTPEEGGAMPKSAVVRRASRRHGRPRPAELPSLVEGQIAEICRDLAVEAKRMRQLQEQADELRQVIRQWAGHSEAHSYDDVS